MDIFGENIDCCDDETGGGGGQPIVADILTNSTGDNTIDLTSPNIDLQTTGNVLINGNPINQGGGDVSGPISSVDGNIAIYNGISGKLIKDQGVSLVSLIDDLDTAQIQITALETKTQYQSASGNVTTFVSQIRGGTVRPLVNNSYSLGIQTAQWKKIWTNELNISTTAITEKTIFTDDQELVSKLYVDTSISNIPFVDLTNLNTKTQNIDLLNTDSTKTTFNQNLITTNIKHPSLSADITMDPGIISLNATNTYLNCTVELGELMLPSIASGVDIGAETIGQFRNIFCDRLGGLSAPTNASDATTKDYVDGLITPLETRTQNQTAIAAVTTFQGEVLATTNFQVQDDPTIYGRLNNNSVLLGNTSGFSYSRFENATLKIEAVSTSPSIPQIDFNFGFNTNNKMSIQNDKTVFNTKAITSQTVFNDVNEFVPKSYIDKRGGGIIAYGGSEQNIFSNRTFYQLYGDSTAQTNNAINVNNVYIAPYSGIIKSISWIKENTPASTIQIQKNNDIDELNKFTFTGLSGRIFTNIPFISSDAISLTFRNDNGTSGQSKYFLYCEFNTSGIVASFNASSLNLSAPPESIHNRLTQLENRLNELTN